MPGANCTTVHGCYWDSTAPPMGDGTPMLPRGDRIAVSLPGPWTYRTYLWTPGNGSSYTPATSGNPWQELSGRFGNSRRSGSVTLVALYLAPGTIVAAGGSTSGQAAGGSKSGPDADVTT